MLITLSIPCSKIFVDCGTDFTVVDTNGEQPLVCMVAAITQVCCGVVWCGAHGEAIA